MNFIKVFFRSVFLWIFVFITCICMLGYTLLNTTENLLSKENIVNTIKNIDIVQLLGEEHKQEIYDVLKKADIPTEYIDSMLEDEQLKETIGEYTALSLDYLLTDKKPPTIDEIEITNILINSFDEALKEAEQHNELSAYITEERKEQIHEKIEYYVPEVVDKIPEVEEFIENQMAENSTLADAKQQMEDFEQMLDKIQMIYSYKSVLLIGIIVSMLFIILIKCKEFRFFKWLAYPCIITAVIVGVMNYYVPVVLNKYMPSELSMIESIIIPTIETFLSNLKQATWFYGVLGIIFILAQMWVVVYKKYRQK